MLALVLIYSGFSVNFAYSTIAPFFPSELHNRGFPPLYNSIVFAIYALSFATFGFLSKKLFIPACGRVSTFLLAALLQLVAILMLGLLPLVPSQTAFLVVSVIARFLQGAAASV